MQRHGPLTMTPMKLGTHALPLSLLPDRLMQIRLTTNQLNALIAYMC